MPWDKNKNMLVPYYLMLSYLYYKDNTSLVSDEVYDNQVFININYANGAHAAIQYFSDTNSFNSYIGGVSWDKTSISDAGSTTKEIHGFSTSTKPHNVVYNVQKKLPLFTKSKKSKSLYCAGYYIIKFDKGWVRSFCPKLVTLETYDYKGPFKTEFTMREELKNANKRSY